MARRVQRSKPCLAGDTLARSRSPRVLASQQGVRRVGRHDALEIGRLRIGLLKLTRDIVVAQVASNCLPIEAVPALVESVYEAVATLRHTPAETMNRWVPVVSAADSVTPDHMICMACGARRKMLRAHLRTAHGMTPELYRKHFCLPPGYSLTCPNYVETRRQMAYDSQLAAKRAGSGRGGSARHIRATSDAPSTISEYA